MQEKINDLLKNFNPHFLWGILKFLTLRKYAIGTTALFEQIYRFYYYYVNLRGEYAKLQGILNVLNIMVRASFMKPHIYEWNLTSPSAYENLLRSCHHLLVIILISLNNC